MIRKFFFKTVFKPVLCNKIDLKNIPGEVNYPGFDGDKGELKAFYEFITENKVDYKWIGMNGKPTGMSGYYHENVALIIHSIN